MKMINLDTSIISLTCSSSSSLSSSSLAASVALKIVDALLKSSFVTIIGDVSSSSVVVSLFTSLRRLPKDGSLLPVPLQYAGWQPSRHVRTFASNTRKFDSGILKALKRASRLSPSRRRSKPGNT